MCSYTPLPMDKVNHKLSMVIPKEKSSFLRHWLGNPQPRQANVPLNSPNQSHLLRIYVLEFWDMGSPIKFFMVNPYFIALPLLLACPFNYYVEPKWKVRNRLLIFTSFTYPNASQTYLQLTNLMQRSD